MKRKMWSGKKLFRMIACLMAAFVLLGSSEGISGVFEETAIEVNAATLSGSLSGKCGTKAKWKVSSDGVLSITGSGTISDYKKGKAPWYGCRSKIKAISVGKKITSIGSYAFYGLDSVAYVSGCKKVTKIGNHSFHGCTSLVSVAGCKKVTSVGKAAFYQCTSLTTIGDTADTIYLPKCTSVGNSAFRNCSQATNFNLPKLKKTGKNAFSGSGYGTLTENTGSSQTNQTTALSITSKLPDVGGLFYESGSVKKGTSGTALSPVKNKIKKLAKKAGNKTTLSVVFIGNSLTLHPLTNYWWGTWGMAASSQANDYAHQTISALSKYTDVSWKTAYFASWETSTSRKNQLGKLNSVLTDSVDLIVIQLGENVTNYFTIEDDYRNLYDYCKVLSPKAKIIVVGGLWSVAPVEAAKQSVAAERGVYFMSIGDMKYNAGYVSSVGASVGGDDGATHYVNYVSTAAHPSDAGMLEIANRIIVAINNS